ncbi:MAG: Gfo/Idh/MocA family oxidoreductase [Victivallaceae bacterium]|nr:Gfo/Idh/MocA family oxidoreductase [Victivallaceae bacterium]
MKKIGFLDYYIDEWHANQYPEMLAASRWKNEFEVAYAWEEVPASQIPTATGKQNLEQWCTARNIRVAGSIQELADKSDAIVLLAPGWPEYHERLSRIILTSGKPVYIDKPMADSYGAAKRMFALADAYRTPVMSSSALRFGSHLQAQLNAFKNNPVDFASCRGNGKIRGFINYGIHQIETLVMALGTGACKVMQLYGTDSEIDFMLIDYPDGRRGTLNRMPGLGFELIGCCRDHTEFRVSEFTDFFPNMIDNMMQFFVSGRISVSREQTLEAMRIFEAGIRALAVPGMWVDCPAE